MTPALARTLNALGLIALSGGLAIAFLDQFIKGDLPCPICLLQRVGLTAVGVGLALNLIVGPRPAHYGVMIISALIGGAVSLRQIALHVVPGTGSYGDAIFGMHFYTWAFVAFVVVIIGSAAMLFFETQFEKIWEMDHPRLDRLSQFAIGLFVVLALANTLSTVAECELGMCPENPTTYQLFHSGTGNG